MKIRVGDTVVVIAGKDKGKTGEVLQVLAKEERVIVEGGIVNKEAPIHVSNVAFYDSKSKSAVKLGYKVAVDENGKKTKVRVNKKTGAEVDSKKKK